MPSHTEAPCMTVTVKSGTARPTQEAMAPFSSRVSPCLIPFVCECLLVLRNVSQQIVINLKAVMGGGALSHDPMHDRTFRIRVDRSTGGPQEINIGFRKARLWVACVAEDDFEPRLNSKRTRALPLKRPRAPLSRALLLNTSLLLKESWLSFENSLLLSPK